MTLTLTGLTGSVTWIVVVTEGSEWGGRGLSFEQLGASPAARGPEGGTSKEPGGLAQDHRQSGPSTPWLPRSTDSCPDPWLLTHVWFCVGKGGSGGL